MIWTYHALSKSGNNVNGNIEGDIAKVKDYLHHAGLIQLLIYPNLKSSLDKLCGCSAIDSTSMANFFDDLSHMLISGMGLHESIQALSVTVSHVKMKEVLIVINQELTAGEGFSKSVTNSKAFPSVVTACISCGEQTGKLIEVVNVLAQYFKYRNQVAGKLLSACFYPIFVFILLVGVMIFVSIKVIPQLKPLLPVDALNQPATIIVLGMTTLIKSYWLFLVLGGVLLGVGLIYLYNSHKIFFEEQCYEIPVIGELIKDSNISLIFSYLTVLIKSGVPILKAIVDIHEAMPSYISAQLMDCRTYMLGGGSFSQALEKKYFFPKTLIVSVKKAEQTVRWDMYLHNIAEYYGKRAQTKVEMLTLAIQPMLLGLGGGFLILIGLAFLVPVYGSLNKIAGG